MSETWDRRSGDPEPRTVTLEGPVLRRPSPAVASMLKAKIQAPRSSGLHFGLRLFVSSYVFGMDRRQFLQSAQKLFHSNGCVAEDATQCTEGKLIVGAAQ